MHSVLEKLNLVKNKVNDIVDKKQLKTKPTIIVVTKKFSLSHIQPLLSNGHIHFGENKVQEAESKWSKIKNDYKNIKLHMVGGLQSNKAKKAVKLFDYIHSLDNDRLSLKISQYEKELGKKIKLFIQVNLGSEDQKSGIKLNLLDEFYNYCTKELSLNIIGLMCLPPIELDSNKYFKLMFETAMKLNLNELSMGMSSDYEGAILNNSTFIRIGTSIMGDRNAI
jgi:hypothetical protein